ncbi:MAG TPA: PVC-type heme-binding CxxCH protein, partial [Tepidisphaeraceae bacterium]|nr:PVC-type heme-binding CxxCH protein [Tepidisphaeraceae bacterium]
MRKTPARTVLAYATAVVCLSIAGATGFAADEAADSAAANPGGQTWPKLPILKVDESKAPAFKEAEEAAKGFRVPKNLKLSLFAAEPQLVSPVAISVDEKGRVYVVETFRAWGNGGIDMRKFMWWLDHDLAARTVEDRVAWSKKVSPSTANNLTLDSDRLRLVEDTDGDGKADKSTLMLDGFNTIESGVAAGVLAWRSSVYFANIPHLYRFDAPTASATKVEKPEELSGGMGVHYQFIGHDLHGLAMGPDGKLYYSIGDRGVSFTTKEGKKLDNPDSGVVFRSDPDGANLEIVATGLRNPQELAFDDYGNLFTGDNNCDQGDSARWVYVVEGLDAGWRVGYQFVTEPNAAGIWNSEKMWHLENDHPAAWCLPPVGHAPPGPAGLAHYPGTGWGEKYRDKFFLCDFRGGTNSGVWAVGFKPKGATFEVADKRQFFWNLLPTDVEFGPDGSMYVSDWVNGWFRPMKGRIWKLSDPQAGNLPEAQEAKKLITEGVKGKAVDELVRLIGHPNQRVRLESQYELAAQGGAAVVGALQKAAAGEENDRLARLHAIWGLGQLARKDAKVLEPIAKLLDDGDNEVRAQAAKILGDRGVASA